jgi:site-specific DNA recombinase
MKTAWSYARRSHSSQKEMSCEAQHANNIRNAGFIDVSVTSQYTEVASGRSDARPIFQQMYQDCKTAKKKGNAPDYIFVSDWDRFFRNTGQALAWMDKFFRLGVAINCPTPGMWLDGDDVGNILVFHIRLSMAEMESRKTSERVSKAIYYMQAGGHYPHMKPRGFVQIGTDEAGKRLYGVDETLREAYTTLYKKITAGVEPFEIYKELGGRQTFGAKTTFFKNLRNPLYAGKVHAKAKRPGHVDKLVDSKLPSIISWSLFELAMHVMDGKVSPKVKSNDGMFALGTIKCPTCNHNLTSDQPIKTSKSGKKTKFQYYRCNQKHVRYPAKDVHQALDSAISCIYLDKGKQDKLKQMFRVWADSDLRAANARLSSLREDLEKQTNRTSKALAMMVDGEISRAEYDVVATAKASIEQQIAKELAKLQGIDSLKLAFAKIVENIGTLVPLMNESEKSQFCRVLFPAGFTVQNGTCRTGYLNSIFQLLSDKQLVTNTIIVESEFNNSNTSEKCPKADHSRTISALEYGDFAKDLALFSNFINSIAA